MSENEQSRCARESGQPSAPLPANFGNLMYDTFLLISDQIVNRSCKHSSRQACRTHERLHVRQSRSSCSCLEVRCREDVATVRAPATMSEARNTLIDFTRPIRLRNGPHLRRATAERKESACDAQGQPSFLPAFSTWTTRRLYCPQRMYNESDDHSIFSMWSRQEKI